jgi:hypothetical protein
MKNYSRNNYAIHHNTVHYERTLAYYFFKSVNGSWIELKSKKGKGRGEKKGKMFCIFKFLFMPFVLIVFA